MGLTLDELTAVVDATRRAGRNYMMMETAVYTREYLYVQDLIRGGELGRVSFARGAHLQDTVGYADYWKGFPPHLYMTHAVSPILGLLDATAARVHCLGSGTLPADWQARWHNPYPVETAIFRLRRSDVAMEITRSLFQVARSFIESFAVYGDRRGFEWQQLDGEDPALFTLLPPKAGDRATPVEAQRVPIPDTASRLPAGLADYTRSRNVSADPARPRMVGGGHGGSHPHLVNEFVRSVVEGRPAAVNELVAANWTAPGICAHASALAEGEAVDIPLFA
jgi:predicted dehydrogenase